MNKQPLKRRMMNRTPYLRNKPAPAMRRSLLSAAVLSVLLSSVNVAARETGSGRSLGRSLDRLAPAERASEATQAPQQHEVLEGYRRIESRLQDPRERAAVQQRMAELEMAEGEERDMAGVARPYAAAIARYESLLERADAASRESILYQLARAYDLSGDSSKALGMFDLLLTEFPDNPWRVEALFRRGEIHFSNDRYEPASLDYAKVVEEGEDTPYHQNARYMLGWAWFKQGAFAEGLDQFLPLIAGLQGETTLTRAEQELLDDTMRVTVLSLQNLEGSHTLAQRMAEIERPDWQYTVYEHLADRYVAQERWQEAGTTWSTFVAENPGSAKAPAAQEALIAVLDAGNFPSDARKRQEEYVALFGAGSDWRRQQREGETATVDTTLKSYLDTLANTSHVAVQERAKKAAAQSEDYIAAAKWYEASLQNFPDSPDVPHQLLLLGDLYTQAGDHRRAVATYRRLTDDHASAPEATDAAYAAVLGLRKLHDAGENGETELSLRMLVDAQMAFAMDRRDDPRATAVQVSAANDLFLLQSFPEAETVAANVIETWPAAEATLRIAALTILGHSRFETGNFAGAETAYVSLQPLLVEAEKREPIRERLLAAVYKQGEAAEKAGDAEAAIGHYLRLAGIDAASETALRGGIDAVALMEKGGDALRAATLLADLRTRHADHVLLKDADLRLAALYEESGKGAQAAAELVRLADGSTDAEVRRQSRYRAAELYLEAGDAKAAAAQFERYVRDHAEPASTRIEAMQQLVTLHDGRGDERGADRVRQQIIDAHERLGASASERTATLAARAGYALALRERQAFDAVSLRAPLQRTLKQKSELLQQSVAAFEDVVNYQVQEVTTAATFQIADLYKSLAAAIMASQRPSGLSAEELTEYELLLEEEAYPFEEKAIAIHELNSQRSWEGVYDEWVRKSFDELRRMAPGRFDKAELEISDAGRID